jgi:membrane protein YdbS with pleckstrin-like domain
MENEQHFADGLDRPTEHPPKAGVATILRAPAFADGSARALEPGWIGASRFGGLVFFGIVGAIAYVALFTTFLVGDFQRAQFLTATGALTAIVAVVLALTALWPKWEYARAGYRFRPDRIEVWSGLVFRRSVSVPISRVQYTDVKQGPVQRSHGIATLVVHTAGTVSSSIEFPGLPPALAAEVRDWLVAQTGSDAV